MVILIQYHSKIELLLSLCFNNVFPKIKPKKLKIISKSLLPPLSFAHSLSMKSSRISQDTDKIATCTNLINGIKENPYSRRHIVSGWNPTLIDEMALPPCHTLFQFYVADKNLSCQLYQRSADVFLGVPFNIASYALLTHMVAQVCNLKAHKFVHTFGDTHLYLNHIEQANLQLTRNPKPLPKLKLNTEIDNIFEFKYEDIEVIDYESHPLISAPIAV